MERFFFDRDIDAKVLGPKNRRKILAHDKDLMACHLYFDEGAVGDPHTHPHTQIALVLSGRFEFTLEGETKTLSAGDSVYIPSNALHGLVCLEKGELVDIFTPEREDFLS